MARFRAFAANRGVKVETKVAERLVAAAKTALPTGDAEVARQVLAADLELLAGLDTQIAQVDARIAALLPTTPFAVLTTTPGWGALRASAYAAALGEPSRWPSASQVYRAAGLTPATYESAGKRRDGGISREGSVWLRRAILDLGVGGVAVRAGRQGLRRQAACPWQTRRRDRLCVGASSEQDRVRDGPRPGRLRSFPLELTFLPVIAQLRQAVTG